MAFASNFGRILSPTFQPNSQAKKAGGWWLAGGIDPDDCVAAYQPKGAASYAASKVNLANPGTYDASEGKAPAWDTSTGWTGGDSAYLNCGFCPPSGDESWSLIVRFTGNPTNIWMDNHYLLGSDSGYNRGFGISGRGYGKLDFRNGGSYTSGVVASGIACVAGLNAYLNGNDIGDLSSAEYYYDTGLRFFANYKSTPDIFWPGTIQAAAVYNVTLTSTQVANLSTAMAAL